MPGPLLTITIGESAKKGAKAGPLLIVGHAILEGALVILLLMGLSSFLNNRLFKLCSFFSGGVILLFMGWSMVRNRAQMELSQEKTGEKGIGNSVLLGIIGSLSNPYWIIWWATIGLGYLVASVKYKIPGVIAFFTGHILADFAWYTFVSFSVARGRKILSPKFYRGLISCCGVFLFFFGGWFLVEFGKLLLL